MSIGAIGVVALVGAAHGEELELNRALTAYTAGPLTLTVTKIDASKKDFVMWFELENDGDRGIIVALSDLLCFRGDERSTFLHSRLGIGERTIDLLSGQTKRFQMVCEHSAQATGSFAMSVRSVYANESNDGESMGDRVVADVLWRIEDSQLDRELQQSGKAKVTTSHVVPTVPAAVVPPSGASEPSVAK